MEFSKILFLDFSNLISLGFNSIASEKVLMPNQVIRSWNLLNAKKVWFWPLEYGKEEFCTVRKSKFLLEKS